MRIEVLVQATTQEGMILWGYHHDEVVVPGEDQEENALRLAGGLVKRIDEAKEAVLEQAGVDLPLLTAEAGGRP